MLAFKSLIIFITNLISSFLGIVVYFFAVKKYTPFNFGLLQVSTSLLAFFLFFSDLNFTTTHVKLMAEEKYTKNEYFTTYLALKVSFIVLMIFIFIIIILIQFDSGYLSNTSLQINIIIILFIDYIIKSLNLVYSSSFQAKLRIKQMQIPILISALVKNIFQLVLLFISKDFIFYVIGLLIGDALIFILYIFLGRDFKIIAANKLLFKEYFNFGWALMLSQTINVFIINIGPMIFKSYYGESILGVFQVLNSALLVFILLQSAFRALLIPNYSFLIAKKKFKQINQEIILYERYMVTIVGVLIISVFISGPMLILEIFGPFYLEHGLSYLYLSIIFSISWGLLGPYLSLVVASGNSFLLLLGSISSLIFSIFSWVFIIPLFGIIGIQMGIWMGAIFGIILYRTYLIKKYKFGKFNKTIIKLLLTICIFALISFVFQKFITRYAIFPSLMANLGFISVYIGILFLLKILTKEDFNTFKRIFKISNFIKRFDKKDIQNS